MPTKRTEARAAPSPIVSANTMAGEAHADRGNRGQSSGLTFRASHHRSWLSPCRPRVQRQEQRIRLFLPSPQLLAEPTSTEGTEARAAASGLLPATTMAACAHDDRQNGGQCSYFTFRAHQQRSSLCPRRPSEQRPERRPHQSCPPPPWLAEPMPTKRTDAWQRPRLSGPPPHWQAEPTPIEGTEVRAAPSSVVPATTVAG
jgi:hypothetical protein